MPVAGPRYFEEKIKEPLSNGLLLQVDAWNPLAALPRKARRFPVLTPRSRFIVLLCAARYDLLSFVILFPFCTGLVDRYGLR